MTTRPTLPEVVGRHLREWRVKHAVSADAVAEGARLVGLNWQRSAVSALEGGRRGLSLADVLLLPRAMTFAAKRSGREVVATLEDLLPAEYDQSIAVTGAAVASATAIRQALGGVTPDPEEDDGWTFPKINDRARAAVRDFAARVEADGLGKVSRRNLERIYTAAALDAEQAAARALRVPASHVAAAAITTWDRSLTEERELRFADRSDSQAMSSRAQAIAKGHITRTLLAELEPNLPNDRSRP